MRVFVFVGFLAIATALPNPETIATALPNPVTIDIGFTIATALPNPETIATALPNPETRASSCAKIPAWMKAAMGKAPAGDRIVGGTNAAGVVPWQVSIRDNESGADDNGKPYEKNTHFCGGTILDAKTILSAAHCFPNGQKEDLTFRQIMAGSVNVQDTKTSQRIAIEKLIWNTKHPWDKDVTMNNDIVIIKLKSPLKFNGNVQPACLPDVASFDQARASKQMTALTGWGLLKDKTGDTPNLLQFVPLPMFPDQRCGYMDDGLYDGMFCAGYLAGGKDPCQGDSGGPLVMAKSSTDDTAVIIGAVSHSMNKCGPKNNPAIHAKVTKYLDWIKANMG